MPYVHHFIEWITFDGNNLLGKHNNYFSYVNLVVFTHNNTLKVNFTIESFPERITGINVTLLLVSKKVANGNNTAQYVFYTYDG